ncbi:sigma-70 family RNA polymerase sigma factor [Streptomyces sp. NPDC048489]|uniref:sigma-70 family RNA polymerase sigma factor n=1 Tax=Streptomyces sp. NPDC048489 TaxID=3154504 RepID=UPI003448CEE4
MSWTFMGSDSSPVVSTVQEREDHEQQVLDLHAYVSRLLNGDRQRAEDIVQETMLRCWRTHGCIGSTILRPWLFRVAKNLVIDGYRSSKARPQEVDGSQWLEYEQSEADPIEDVLTSTVIRQALDTLSLVHRQALIEIYFRGRTLDEAAYSIGIPKGTLKSRVHYGLVALQKTMQSWLDE